MRISLGGSKWLHDTTARWRAKDKPLRGEDAARKDALSVGLAQPHRRGSDDPRHESPLGRFCLSAGLSGHVFNAGVRYRELVLEARQAMGLGNPGWSAGTSGYTDGMDDEQIKKRVRESRANQERADVVLKRIHLRLPRAMRDMCVLEIEAHQQDSKMLRAGLVALDALFSEGRKKSRSDGT